MDFQVLYFHIDFQVLYVQTIPNFPCKSENKCKGQVGVNTPCGNLATLYFPDWWLKFTQDYIFLIQGDVDVPFVSPKKVSIHSVIYLTSTV
jgi:hypothetical protein